MYWAGLIIVATCELVNSHESHCGITIYWQEPPGDTFPTGDAIPQI